MASSAEHSAPPAIPTSVDVDLTEIQETLSEKACIDKFVLWVKNKDIDDPSDLTRLRQIVKELRDAMSGRHLLVWDKNVDPDSTLANVINKVTHKVVYDSTAETTSNLIRKIRERHLKHGKPYESVGFATHAGTVWKLAKDLNISIEDVSTDAIIAQADPVVTALVSCVGKGGRVDILGCSLLEYSPDLVNRLEAVYGINFAASDDKTGNVAAGGDWILESDGVDVAPVYFDPEKLQAYKGTMFWGWIVGQGAKQAAKVAAKQAAKALAKKIVKKLFKKALRKKLKQMIKKRFGKKLSKKLIKKAKKKFQRWLKKKIKKEIKEMTKEEQEEAEDEFVTDESSLQLQKPENQLRLERAADRAANAKLDEIFAFGWDDFIPFWGEAKMVQQVIDATNSDKVKNAVDAAVEKEVGAILEQWSSRG